jgi:hypothetical protein
LIGIAGEHETVFKWWGMGRGVDRVENVDLRGCFIGLLPFLRKFQEWLEGVFMGFHGIMRISTTKTGYSVSSQEHRWRIGTIEGFAAIKSSYTPFSSIKCISGYGFITPL